MLKNYSDFSSFKELNKILKELTEQLDITPSHYQDAVSKYEAVANYLKEDTTIGMLEPDMYPQGSFGLGTVIKPISDKDEYDIDLVCELKRGNTTNLTQNDLKNLIGNRLKEGRYKDKLKELDGGRRCWTIEYSESSQLHMDILPAIPDSRSRLFFESVQNTYGNTAISITDKEHPDFYIICDDWVKSNPRGYQKWFKDQMLVRLNENKRLFAEQTKANIDDVPDYKVKTPLQRAIQLLKRHRDSTCVDNDDRPISIIITTLSAKAYNNEDNLYEALISILNKMTDYIEYEERNGKRVAVVENPVDSRENFADKWEQFPVREKVFLQWVESARQYFRDLLKNEGGMVWLNESLNKGFGGDIVKRTFTALGENTKSAREGGDLRMSIGTGVLGANLAVESSKKVKNHTFHGNGR